MRETVKVFLETYKDLKPFFTKQIFIVENSSIFVKCHFLKWNICHVKGVCHTCNTITNLNLSQNILIRQFCTCTSYKFFSNMIIGVTKTVRKHNSVNTVCLDGCFICIYYIWHISHTSKPTSENDRVVNRRRSWFIFNFHAGARKSYKQR